jgi:predicted ester cyclase
MPDTAEKALARRVYDVLWTRGELDQVDRLIGRGYVGEAPGTRPVVGRDGLRGLVRRWRRGFPDLVVDVDGQLGEADRVVSRLTFRGTHGGRFAGMSRTRRPLELPVIAMMQTQAGTVTQEWFEFDRRLMLEQLGLVPPLT